MNPRKLQTKQCCFGYLGAPEITWLSCYFTFRAMSHIESKICPVNRHKVRDRETTLSDKSGIFLWILWDKFLTGHFALLTDLDQFFFFAVLIWASFITVALTLYRRRYLWKKSFFISTLLIYVLDYRYILSPSNSWQLPGHAAADISASIMFVAFH